MFGQIFLTALVIFPFMCLLGFVVEMALFSRDMGRAGNTIKNLVFFVGVIVHEISHRVMCALAGVPAHNISVKYRGKYGNASQSGSVSLRNKYQINFVQGVLICFAPLLIGVWVLYFLLQVAFNPFFDPVIRVIAGICCFSVFITISPSQADLSMVKFSFQNDPSHGFYQIVLVVISFLLSWMLVGLYNIILPLEFLYYFIIISFYFGFKYSFIGLRWIINKIHFRKRTPHSAAGYRRYARRHYKPKNPYGGQS